MRIYLSDHAVLRYQQRVKPALDLKAAGQELDALCKAASNFVADLPWKAEVEGPFLIPCDGVAIAVTSGRGDRWIATTVLTRGTVRPEIRTAKNRERVDRREKQEWRQNRRDLRPLQHSRSNDWDEAA